MQTAAPLFVWVGSWGFFTFPTKATPLAADRGTKTREGGIDTKSETTFLSERLTERSAGVPSVFV